MPRYDYECQSCRHGFELKQSYSSKPVADCPECGNVAHRLIHSVPIVFKGSGFYVNDYGKGANSTDTTPKSKPAESKKQTKPNTDSKPESDSQGVSKKETTSAK